MWDAVYAYRTWLRYAWLMVFGKHFRFRRRYFTLARSYLRTTTHRTFFWIPSWGTAAVHYHIALDRCQLLIKLTAKISQKYWSYVKVYFWMRAKDYILLIFISPCVDRRFNNPLPYTFIKEHRTYITEWNANTRMGKFANKIRKAQEFIFILGIPNRYVLFVTVWMFSV